MVNKYYLGHLPSRRKILFILNMTFVGAALFMTVRTDSVKCVKFCLSAVF